MRSMTPPFRCRLFSSPCTHISSAAESQQHRKRPRALTSQAFPAHFMQMEFLAAPPPMPSFRVDVGVVVGCSPLGRGGGCSLLLSPGSHRDKETCISKMRSPAQPRSVAYPAITPKTEAPIHKHSHPPLPGEELPRRRGDALSCRVGFEMCDSAKQRQGQYPLLVLG